MSKGRRKANKSNPVRSAESMVVGPFANVDELFEAEGSLTAEPTEELTAPVNPAERKNNEMRWQVHYSSARKAIASEDFQSAVVDLQSCVKFGQRLGDYRLANSFAELGYVALRLNQFDTARSFIRMAIGARETAYGANHPSVAIEYNNLAMTYEWEQDYTNAKPFLLKAVSILEAHNQFDQANYAEPYEGLSGVYLAQGEFQKAEQFCMKALQVRDEVLGRLHPASMKTVQSMLTIHRLAGNKERATAARNVYAERLQDFANSTSAGATAEAIRRALEWREQSVDKEIVDVRIGDFLRQVARL